MLPFLLILENFNQVFHYICKINISFCDLHKTNVSSNCYSRLRVAKLSITVLQLHYLCAVTNIHFLDGVRFDLVAFASVQPQPF